MRPDQGEQQNYYNGMEEIQVDIIIKKKLRLQIQHLYKFERL